MTDREILEALAEIRPDGRATLRKYLIADQHDRDGLLLGLYRDGRVGLLAGSSRCSVSTPMLGGE